MHRFNGFGGGGDNPLIDILAMVCGALLVGAYWYGFALVDLLSDLCSRPFESTFAIALARFLVHLVLLSIAAVFIFVIVAALVPANG